VLRGGYRVIWPACFPGKSPAVRRQELRPLLGRPPGPLLPRTSDVERRFVPASTAPLPTGRVCHGAEALQPGRRLVSARPLVHNSIDCPLKFCPLPGWPSTCLLPRLVTGRLHRLLCCVPFLKSINQGSPAVPGSSDESNGKSLVTWHSALLVGCRPTHSMVAAYDLCKALTAQAAQVQQGRQGKAR